MTAASSTAIRNTRLKKPISGPLRGIPVPPILIGCSRQPRAADRPRRGSADDAVAAAIPAFLRSCAAFQRAPDTGPLTSRVKDVDFGSVADWREPCASAANLPAGDDNAARRFFETGFVPLLAGNNGAAEG